MVSKFGGRERPSLTARRKKNTAWQVSSHGHQAFVANRRDSAQLKVRKHGGTGVDSTWITAGGRGAIRSSFSVTMLEYIGATGA